MVALLVIAKTELIKRPSTDTWINDLSYVHTMENYLDMKRNKLLVLSTASMNGKNRMPSGRDRNHKPTCLRPLLFEILEKTGPLGQNSVAGGQELDGREGAACEGTRGNSEGQRKRPESSP